MNKYLLLFTLLFVVACSDSDTSSESSDSSRSSETDLAECSLGRFDFITTSDNKKHFDAYFAENGLINYNLNGAPQGSYEISGNDIAIVGPFGANKADVTWNWTITDGSGEDCDVNEMRGTSLAGTSMVAIKTD